jgi:hypothetical protein
MKFIDILVEVCRDATSSPVRIKELLFFFTMDLALKSKKLSERKAWETLGSLISLIFKQKRFPNSAEIDLVKNQVNSLHREKNTRTSDVLFSLKMFELGEAEVKKFFNSRAWKGMPGFKEDGTPLE